MLYKYLFNPHNNHICYKVYKRLYPLYRWENQGIERLRSLPKITGKWQTWFLTSRSLALEICSEQLYAAYWEGGMRNTPSPLPRPSCCFPLLCCWHLVPNSSPWMVSQASIQLGLPGLTNKIQDAHAIFGSMCVHAQSLQSCLTLCDPMDCRPPGSSVRGILWARILDSPRGRKESDTTERLAFPFSLSSGCIRD